MKTEMVIDKNIFDTLYLNIKMNTYICSECGKTIFPDVEFSDDEHCTIKSSRNEIRGGKGNEIRKRNICSKCIQNIRNGVKGEIYD